MTTGAITRYQVLYDSLRSRRRKPETYKGLDLLASQAGTRIRHARISLRWLRREAERIDELAPSMRSHSDAALDALAADLREVFVRGRQDREAVRRALAGVREIARRETGEEAYPVQIMGALALYHGRVIEMVTGEGKTLTGSLAAPLMAWQHRHLHVFTVNDYLASRDAASRAPIYRRCGLAVAAIVQQMPPSERAAAYAAPIVYGTPKQITADWLRDQLRLSRLNTPWAGRRLLGAPGGAQAGTGPLVPGLRAAIVDEADAVLIDEGVVPLIIARSRKEDEMARVYREAAAVAADLSENTDYRVDYLRRRAKLTERGRQRCEQRFERLDDPIWRAARRAEELVRQALVARHCYLNGHQYQIVDGRVVIVDEYTGRFLPDRSWEHGLHQAVEAKEGLEVTADRETLARMSFQRFFRSYPMLCGMTGTIADARVEIERVYRRPISIIPTNRPLVREQWPTRVFRSGDARWNAVADSVRELHEQGRPVLIGTRSIEASELLSQRLGARGLAHHVLNANFDRDEADTIAQAGRAGTITVATNMAGRGTDIVPDDGARRAGGLHVILTEMHTARRIDRQFMGRAGRQGDPGSAQVFASLEDELLRLYTRRAAAYLRRASGGEELTGTARLRGVALLRLAQRRAEARARRMRAAVLRQDDWIEKHLPGG